MNDTALLALAGVIATGPLAGSPTGTLKPKIRFDSFPRQCRTAGMEDER